MRKGMLLNERFQSKTVLIEFKVVTWLHDLSDLWQV
jgi:hypothetical protein